MSSLKPSDCGVYNQYIDTHLENFIKRLCDSYHQATAPYHELYSQVNNLALATGKVLDEYGKTLSFNRYITFNDPLDVVRPNTDGIDEYLVISQRDNDILKQCRLNDKAFRTVLRLLVESRNTVSSVSSLSRIISDIVDADVFVGDSFNMQYITYYFLDRIPGWLEVTMHNFDILPRPAGMSAEYISAFARFFGFLIEDPYPDEEATAKVFSAFWKARFPTIEPKKIILPSTAVISHPPYNPGVSPEAVKYLGHLYNKARTLDEVTIRDRYRDTLLLMEQAQEDRKYMYIPKSHQGIVFPNFTTALEDESQDESQQAGLMWEAKQKALKSWEEDQHKWMLRARDKEIYDTHADPRRGLFFDASTGWYFYQDKDPNTGKFDPLFIANLYQDSCALWRPLDDLPTQAEQGYVILRPYHDLPSSPRRLRLNTSPYITKYLPLFRLASEMSKLQAQHDDRVGRDKFPISIKLRNLYDNLHYGIRLHHTMLPFARRSFRACLDMEYFASSLIQYRNHMRDNVLSRTSYKTQQEQDYWRNIVNSLTTYFGTITNYRNFFNDYDTSSPAYKRRVFIKTQRYLVRKVRQQLMDLYNENYRLYNSLSSDDNFTLEGTRVYNLLHTMGMELGGDFWTDIEAGRNGYGAGESYSAIYLDNSAAERYYNDFSAETQRRKDFYDFQIRCRNACERLMNDCGKPNDPISVSRWRDRHDSFLCYVSPDFSHIPQFETDDNQSWDDWGNYYTTKEHGGTPRGCLPSGYRKFSDGYYQHRDKVDSRYNDYLRAQKASNGMYSEKEYNRTAVTHERTLRAVMNYYDSYTPDQDPPRLPSPDTSLEYPFYRYVDWATDLL